MRRFGGILIACGILLSVMIAGCGEHQVGVGAAPPQPANGPAITFVGLLRADDTLVQPTSTTNGVPVFARTTGSGFRLVVEGKPGPNGKAVGVSTYESDLMSLPDLEIEVSRPLGNGSTTVCDVSRTPGPGVPPEGGVPAINPPDFSPNQTNINAVNDLACRFRDGAGNTAAITSRNDGCVKFLPTEDYGFVDSATTTQFCGFITGVLVFPAGDTTVSVRLRDVDGNPGAMAQLVIHVGS
jgi:hypothetical protein